MTMRASFRIMTAFILCCMALVFAIPRATAALPIIDSLKPLGVVRGQESTVSFFGQRVGDAYKVLVDEPGIEILEVKAVNDKQVDVKLKTAATLPPGLYNVRMVTKSGIANLRLLGVGTMPITNEKEPNSEFDTPQSVELNTTVEGVVEQEDLDHYQVQLKAGQTLNVEIEGIRLGYTLNNQNILDPYIAIYDVNHVEVASNDDSSLLQQDSFCSFKAPEDGKYTVLVRDSSFLGSRLGGYRLHVGTFPRPIALMPGGGIPGATLKANLIDPALQTVQKDIQLPTTTHDQWPIVTEDENGISPSPNWVRVNELPVVLEQEPNDDYRKAPEIKVPAAFCGVIEKEEAYDCFAFAAKKGTRYRVETFSRGVLRSPLDAYVNVFDPSGKTLQSGDDARGKLDPLLEFTASVDGLHTVRIYDQLRGGSLMHQYRIEVTTPPPSFALTLKELRRVETFVVPVPSGGSMGMVVMATRSGYDGEINLGLEGLPEGVTATTFPMPAGRTEIPVLLTAAEGTKHDASLFAVNGRGDEKNFHVAGTYSQLHHLVLGQNRRHMWSETTDNSTVAVTDAAPFKIELVQPLTPIVQSGNKELRIKIVRNEGFDGQVSVRTLYNPPGVTIDNSRKIAKDQTETDIAITANGSAAIGEWPVIMIASYTGPTGTAEIATNPIMLNVEGSIFDYKFTKAAGSLGSESTVTVALEIKRPYEGQAQVELVGLPKGVTSPAAIQTIDPKSEAVTFPVTIAADARPGSHKTLVCQSSIKVGDETIVQTTTGGEIRVDVPIAKKPAASTSKTDAEKKKPTVAKALSRLEILRQNK